MSFWIGGYFVSTVGTDEKVIQAKGYRFSADILSAFFVHALYYYSDGLYG